VIEVAPLVLTCEPAALFLPEYLGDEKDIKPPTDPRWVFRLLVIEGGFSSIGFFLAKDANVASCSLARQ